MPDLTHDQRRRIARATLDIAAAVAELGAALAGNDVMDDVETEDMPPEQREITRTLDFPGRGECGLPLDECRAIHDHAPPEEHP